MKRITSILMMIVFVTCLAGCSGDENVEELLSYIQSDVAELSAIEAQLTTSMNTILNDNSSTNHNVYQELATNTMNLAVQLNDKATKISYTIKNEELAEVHSIYIDYTNLLLSAFSMFSSAVQTEDMDLLDEASNKFEEADVLGNKYVDDLDELAKKYGLDLKTE